jgi:hypothetical protein
MPGDIPIYLEVGKTWTFACALDWPGWCRRGKGRDEAIEELIRYIPRYAAVAGRAFSPGQVRVIGEVAGSATTDFGAPAAIGDWDRVDLSKKDGMRLAGLLDKAWKTFDLVVSGAPDHLRKGPRGGGRDRDAIVEHVRDAERSYGRKMGVAVPPRTPWPEQRAAYLDAVRAAGGPGGESAWPLRYVVRRIGWHVVDHAWEIEDRGTASPNP